MDFALTELQTELKAAARRYLSDRYPPSRIAELADAAAFGDAGGVSGRASSDAGGAGAAGDDVTSRPSIGRNVTSSPNGAAGYDAGAWVELVRQGWLDPELGLVELGLLAEESGRALHPTPWWATAGLALPVYLAADAELPGPATLADGADTCRATQEGDCWRLDGTAPAVVDARAATELVVAARTGAGMALFGARPDGPGVAMSPRAAIDPLRGLTDLEFAQASARLLVGPPSAGALLATIGRRAAALLACEAVGVADRALEIAVEYAKVRVQFDRPIGSYQAVGHLLAESYAEVELARSLAYRAVCVLADRPTIRAMQPGSCASSSPRNAGAATACAVHASRRAATRVCEAAIQVCGGLGVTWEFPLHRWYRRALWLDAWFAGRLDPLAALADTVLG